MTKLLKTEDLSHMNQSHSTSPKISIPKQRKLKGFSSGTKQSKIYVTIRNRNINIKFVIETFYIDIRRSIMTLLSNANIAEVSW